MLKKRNILKNYYLNIVYMVIYTCKRCGYSCKNKSYYRKHLLRKIPCEAMLENISIETLLEELSTFNIPNKPNMHDDANTLKIRSNTLKIRWERKNK